MDAIIDNAVARCPFLARVSAENGPAFARSIALNPLQRVESASPHVRRPVLEELDSYQTTFRLWHGASGVVPLPGLSAVGAQGAAPAPAPCPVGKAPLLQPTSSVKAAGPKACTQQVAPTTIRNGSRPLPLATMSLSFGELPDFGKLFKAFQQQHTQRPRRQPAQQKPSRQPVDRAPNVESSVGQCPMRKVLGPLAPIVFNPKGHLQCPEVIVKARAALAATKPVRELRPQALPIKMLAVGATTVAVNIPCGMAREHTEKFSTGWFVAVHASIPFIAMLRKAVIMPKYAILYTIATAIAGQAMGAKLERKRISKPKLVVSKVAAGTGNLVADRVPSKSTYQVLSETSRFSLAAPTQASMAIRTCKPRTHPVTSLGPVHTAIVPHTGPLVSARG